MDIFVQIGVPILTALISFFAATYKSKIELKKQMEINRLELEKIRELTNSQIKIHQTTSKNDLLNTFLQSAINDPNLAKEKLNGLVSLAEMAKTIQKSFE